MAFGHVQCLQRFRGALLAFVLGLIVGSAWAETYTLSGFRENVELTHTALERIERSTVSNGTEDPEQLLVVRDRLRELRLAHDDAYEHFAKQRDALQSDLARLGPAPKQGDPREAVEIALERTRIGKELSDLEAVLRKADLNQALASRLLDEISEARRSAFYERLLQADPSPLEPALIRNATIGLTSLIDRGVSRIRAHVRDQQERSDYDSTIWLLGLALAVGLVLAFPVRYLIVGHVIRRMTPMKPSLARSVIAAGVLTLARFLPFLLASAVFAGAVRQSGFLSAAGTEIALTAWFWALVVIAVDAAATSMFLVEVPGWQLFRSNLRRRLGVRVLVVAVAGVLALDALIRAVVVQVGSNAEFSIVLSATVALLLAIALLLIAAHRTAIGDQLVNEDERDEPGADNGDAERDSKAGSDGSEYIRIGKRIRVSAALTGMVVILATIVGQVSLGYFVATRVFYLAGLLAAAWCLRVLLQEALATLHGEGGSRSKPGTEKSSRAVFYVGLIADLLLFCLVLAPAALILGADGSDISNFIVDTANGINIGSVNVSLFGLISATGAFLLVLAITWLIQRFLDRRVLSHLKVDVGVRHSFRKLVGYVGVSIAFVAAVGALGFNLSNLAIVAGALSVGIGFGLQSIVNNFVSGLILLFERPIKIGDWIVTTAGEGHVRRISVRSTEIETFDRASIIVPNSELVGSAVTNLTHGNNIGRISIPVGVSYDEDPRRIIGLLTDVVRNNADVMRYPEPVIYFADFAASSLNFEIRAYLRDINAALKVRTDLRVAVFECFRKESVQIPYPHRTVQLVREPNEALVSAADAASMPPGTR